VGGVGEQRLRHINDSVLSSLKMEDIRFFLNLCFYQFDNKHVNIVIFVTVIYVTAKPTVIIVIILRSLKERVHSVHITYIPHLVNHFNSEDGACRFLQNFVKTCHCHPVPKPVTATLCQNLSLPHFSKFLARVSM
jgi:hypothetical protein